MTPAARRRQLTVSVVVLAMLPPATPPVGAAELQAKTAAAFERYAYATERRLDDRQEPFLYIDRLPGEERQKTTAALQRGELFIQRLSTKENGRDIDVDDGIVHHWMGVVFVPGITLDRAVALLQDYDRHSQVYAPNVARSKTLSRDGDRFRVYLRFFMKKVVTVVVNSEHEARFTRDGADRAASRIRSTRIAEVDDPGTSEEKELPVGRDSGYLWRLNSYWRFLERDGGVYIQSESVTLTRGIPTGLGWVVRPFVTSIPRDTLTFTLETTRTALSTAATHRAAAARAAAARPPSE
jgi:hypothetical protein